MFNCVHPCPCGFYGDSQKPCTCAAPVVTKYQKRISGPLLDRIDIHDEVQSLMRFGISQFNLSARAYHRILKLARTIADLAGCEDRLLRKECQTLLALFPTPHSSIVI